jgi:hypothetical protein
LRLSSFRIPHSDFRIPMTELEALQARKETILSELSTLASQPTYSIDGQWVDHAAHRQALLNELAKHNDLIARAEGPVEAPMRGA